MIFASHVLRRNSHFPLEDFRSVSFVHVGTLVSKAAGMASASCVSVFVLIQRASAL